MLKERQLNILSLIVQNYTATGTPVGSKKLMDEGIKASSATIRNDMALLEREGLIAKEHTSSGRIPTMEGYRYYVDHLLNPTDIDQNELSYIRTALSGQVHEIDDIVRKSAKILSDITSYTAFSFGPDLFERKLTGFRMIPLNEQQVLAVIVTDNGNVESQVFNKPDYISNEDLKQMVEIINDRLVGEPLSVVYNRMRTEIPMMLNRYFSSTHGVMDLFDHILQGAFKESIFVGGRMNLLDYGIIQNAQDFKNLYRFFGDTSQVSDLIAKPEQDAEHEKDELDIKIGSEINNEIFQNMSLITATYDVKDHGKGTIAILGPTNMEYGKMTGLMEAFRDELATTLDQYYRYLNMSSRN
jgi:heat-inducible transcriptional repressor